MDSQPYGPVRPLAEVWTWEDRVLWAVRACGPVTFPHLCEVLQAEPPPVWTALLRHRIAGLAVRVDFGTWDVTEEGRRFLDATRARL